MLHCYITIITIINDQRRYDISTCISYSSFIYLVEAEKKNQPADYFMYTLAEGILT